MRAMRGAPQLESGQSAELEQRLADGTVGSLQEHALVSLHPGRAVKEAGMRASSSRSVRPPTEVDARRHPGQAVTPERAIGGVRPEYRHIGYPVAQPKAAHTIVELIDFPDDIIAPRSLTRPHLQPPPISQTASGSTAVLEYRPTETLPLLGARLLGFARLCRRCRPGLPPKRRKTRVFPGTEAKSGERRTVCWRRMDSKIQFRDASPPPSARAFIRRPRPTTAQMIPPRRRSIGLNSAEASKPLLISYVTTPISCFFPTIAGARRHRGLSRPLAIEIDDTASPLAYA